MIPIGAVHLGMIVAIAIGCVALWWALVSAEQVRDVAGPMREELRLMADWLGLEGLVLPRAGALGREWSRMGK